MFLDECKISHLLPIEPERKNHLADLIVYGMMKFGYYPG
jgi:hypothetical protein